tara:strand:- start:181 stop:327 length:147 start_codon:yes stop_codon:yes gene_type:complete
MVLHEALQLVVLPVEGGVVVVAQVRRLAPSAPQGGRMSWKLELGLYYG